MLGIKAQKTIFKQPSIWYDIDQNCLELNFILYHLCTCELSFVFSPKLVKVQIDLVSPQLTISGMKLIESSCTFSLLEHIKISRPGNSGPSIKFLCLTPDDEICPVNTLSAYLQRTEKVRQNNTWLLLSYVKTFKPVSRDTISRWLKTVLHAAGIGTNMFTPHST
jgi:hypothetical protein